MAGGIVRREGDWLEVRFEHDLRLTQVLRRVGGRRLSHGRWRLDVFRAAQALREPDIAALDWIGDAAEVKALAIQVELRAQAEDRVALQAKGGAGVLPPWEPPVPLLAHQSTAVEFLAVRSGALLCDEQGLGKTLTCLVAFWLLRDQGKAQRLVIVCPNSLKEVWRTEAGRFFPDWAVVVVGGPLRQRMLLWGVDSDVVILNYELLRRDASELERLLGRSSSVLVCDESHHLKNAGAQTAKALAQVRHAASRLWLMSGTPVPNRLEDVHFQVGLVDGGRLLGSRTDFQRCYVDGRNPVEAAQELRERLEPIMLRRTKEQVLDLPDRVFEARHVPLQGRQRELYEGVRTQLLNEVRDLSETEFARTAGNVLVRMLRLAQIASNPRLVDPDYRAVPPKWTELDAVLTDLVEANRRKVVLWSHYTASIRALLARYERYGAVGFHGAMGNEQRAQAVERFQGGDAWVFVGNPQAGGSGLTLTAASYSVYESYTWRYDLFSQSLARTHRIGQTQSATYLLLVAAGTIEEVIIERLRAKEELAQQVLGDQPTDSFTRADVLEMLSRTPTA